MKFVHFPTFLISLTIGLFLVYIYMPSKQVIYVYPTPDNIEKIQYKDRADNCYEFRSKEVACPMDKSKLGKYDFQ